MQANQSLLRALDCFNDGMLLVDLGEPGWRILYANESWTSITGVPATQLPVYCVHGGSSDVVVKSAVGGEGFAACP